MRRNPASRWRAALAAARLTIAGIGIAVAGCGGEPGLVGVGGKVTYKGAPVTTGDIFFSPVANGARGAQAPLGGDGSYRLGSFAPGDGAYPGKYKVSIIARGPDKPIPPRMKGRMMEEDMQGTGDPLVPKKYLSPESSGLAAEVDASKSNTFDFDLKD